MSGEATIAASEVDVTKREVSNGSPGPEEPPSKKARMEDSSGLNGQDRPQREKGVAPIKAEYASAQHLACCCRLN